MTDTCVFPFHESCFEILLRVLTGSDDASRIEKDSLWNTFTIMALDSYLDMVDYGDISGNDQVWESIAGEEVLSNFRVSRIRTLKEVPGILKMWLGVVVRCHRPNGRAPAWKQGGCKKHYSGKQVGMCTGLPGRRTNASTGTFSGVPRSIQQTPN